MKIVKLLFGILNAAALAALVLEPTGFALRGWPWLARFQFGAAVLAADGLALAVLTALALWKGRLYCETLCPLGIVQDLLRLVTFKRVRRVCSRLPEPRAQRVVRWIVFALVAGSVTLALFLGTPTLAPWFDPYALYLRAVAWKVQPNPGWIVTVFSFAGLALVAVLACCGKGRFWCNWICPVGTLLHCLGKLSRRKDVFDRKAHCERCGKCLKK